MLALRRKVLGPQHPGTLLAMHDLAESYAAAHREDEALALREDLLTFRRMVLGRRHPDTFAALLSLAAAYQANGDTAKAQALATEIAAVRANTD